MDFKELMSYCRDLEANNNRTWFHDNHARYERVKADFEEYLELARFIIAENAPALADDIMYAPVKSWTYRIARDMRYYKDRPPYNPSFRAYISRDKKSWLPIGYFLRLAPGDSVYGTGIWCEDTAQTNRVRDYISAHFLELSELLQKSGIDLAGDRLLRAPRGYDESDPAIEYIKYKNWNLMIPIPQIVAQNDAKLTEFLANATKRMEPLRLFFLRAAESE